MRKQDQKLYFSLIAYALLPSIYLLVRIQIIAVNSVDIDIIGQLEWFDLIDEVLLAFLIEPLYFVLKKNEFRQQSGTLFLLGFGVYTIFTGIVVANISSISAYMAAKDAVQYLSAQAISMLASFGTTFSILLFCMGNDDRSVWAAVIVRIFRM